MRIIAPNRATVCPHRNRLKPHAFIGAQIADQMAVIGMQRIFFRQIKVIAVFHIKFAPPHHTKTRANFIAEFPLDLIERHWQILVGSDVRTENVRHQFLCRWGEQHIAIMAILQPQHFCAIGIVTSTFTPQICALQNWHLDWQMACTQLFFVDDVFQLAQHLKPKGQP